jgi:hypothetical protein
MLGRLYRSSMDHGARILFGIAFLIFVVGVGEALWSVGRLGPDNGFHGDLSAITNQLFAALIAPVMPLTGALLIDRLDRRFALRPGDVDRGDG